MRPVGAGRAAFNCFGLECRVTLEHGIPPEVLLAALLRKLRQPRGRIMSSPAYRACSVNDHRVGRSLTATIPIQGLAGGLAPGIRAVSAFHKIVAACAM